MSTCIGIELDSRTVRGVRLEGWTPRPTRSLEAEWGAGGIEQVVLGLREQLGQARRVAVAIRLPLLLAKRVRLPPLPPAERRKILRLEPQRFFPVRLEDLVIALGEGDLVFAAREDAVAEWAGALEALGPVELVEPGPVALARALRSTGIADGTAVLDDAERGVGVIEIHDGAVTGARRLYGSLAAAGAALSSGGTAPPGRVYVAPWSDDRARTLALHLPGAVLEPLPGTATVPAPFLSAYGAALGVGRDLDDTLLPDELGARIHARRRRELVLGVLACVAAVVFALVSVDAWRSRTVRGLAAEVQALQSKAAPALALRNELGILSRQTQAVAQLQAERPDPLKVLLALSSRLPSGAHLRSLRLTGAGWQIDGYAPQAAGVIQALGGAPEFREVHFLSATNRAQIGDRTYESFSVAFRFVSTP
ncbi:MAG TPA: PilN domain-containing protein [Gemmatimonadales bacterium]|nr:PilN domain-containing protein [Gemmatimonadales bacterium]